MRMVISSSDLTQPATGQSRRLTYLVSSRFGAPLRIRAASLRLPGHRHAGEVEEGADGPPAAAAVGRQPGASVVRDGEGPIRDGPALFGVCVCTRIRDGWFGMV